MSKQIRLSANAIKKGNLILVNYDYPIFNEPDCEELDTIFDNEEVTLLKEASNQLELLINVTDMKEEIVAISGYRTRKEQTCIYEGSIRENGISFTQKYVAFPGHSEHQTGLAIDLAKNQKDIDFICPEFPYDGKFERFRKRAAEYGFIERYGKEKEHITHIAAEPWHFRYVGVPHAKLMKENNMALEEYIQWLKQYDLMNNPLRYVMENQTILIGYVPVLGGECCFMVPDCERIYLSGNNVDGLVVTMYEQK